MPSKRIDCPSHDIPLLIFIGNKEGSIKEIIEMATETSEVNPTLSTKKKKKEKWGDGDQESQSMCNRDAKVHESNVEPVLKISSIPVEVEANDGRDVSFSKKKKKSKSKSEEDQVPEVSVLGIDGVKESVNLTSARACNLDSEAGDATGDENLILEKKTKKVKHSTGKPEFQEFCSGDAISADGEASHSKKKKKEKNCSVEVEGKVCSKGDGYCPTEVLNLAEQGEIQANHEIRSGPSKKRKKENIDSKETDESCSREHDDICPTEGLDCSKLDAEYLVAQKILP